MSFSSDCKEELIRIRVKSAEQRLSQLTGITFTAGGIRISRQPALFYHTENPATAKHIATIALSLFDADAVVEEKRIEHRRKPIYEVTLSGKRGGGLQVIRDHGDRFLGRFRGQKQRYEQRHRLRTARGRVVAVDVHGQRADMTRVGGGDGIAACYDQVVFEIEHRAVHADARRAEGFPARLLKTVEDQPFQRVVV